MSGGGVQPPSVWVNGAISDPHYIECPLNISHGRSKPETQPDAPQATILWAEPAYAPVVGDSVEITAPLPEPDTGEYDDTRVLYDDFEVSYDGGWITPGADVVRFSGVVTQADIEEFAGIPVSTKIVAVNRQADLGRVHVLLDRPAENEIDRVNAIATEAGIALTIKGNAGPMLAPDTLDKDCLGALQEVCLSTGGLVWSNGDGSIIYGTGDHRKDAPPIAAIGAQNILSGLSWNATVADLINSITIKWGPEGSQTQVTIKNQSSIDIYGVRHKPVTTMLNEQADAEYTAQIIMARRSYPFHRITDVMVDSEYVPSRDVALRDIMKCNVSDALLLPIPPDPSPAGILAEWILEGWQEEWPEPTHVIMQMAVSDRARFAQTVLRAWADAMLNTWQAEMDRGAWLDALITSPGNP